MTIRSPFLALGLLASSGLKQRGPDEASAGASKRSSHLELGSFSGLARCGRNLPEPRFRGFCRGPTLRRVGDFSSTWTAGTLQLMRAAFRGTGPAVGRPAELNFPDPHLQARNPPLGSHGRPTSRSRAIWHPSKVGGVAHEPRGLGQSVPAPQQRNSIAGPDSPCHLPFPWQ
jgi:hypothetical protein